MTNMTIIKTAELTGNALDWAVAKCEGVFHYIEPNEKRGITHWGIHPTTRRYSSNWVHGGPYHEQDDEKSIQIYRHEIYNGPTPLIAAMRCFVSGKLGDSVEIPSELL